MHKVEDIYFRNDFDLENELNLFEPECIITDNPLNIKGDAQLFLKPDDNYSNVFENGAVEYPQNGYFNLKNFNTANTSSGFDASQFSSENISTFCESSLTINEQMIDLENLQMHSIFTPEKRNKPKEVFTKCQFCSKFVIIRMCQETGDYTKCKYCFNNPFNNEPSSFIPDKEEASKVILKPRREVPVNNKTESSFKCDHCGKLFTRNWYLKQHIKLHSNEKPYACNHCDKRFLNSSNLKQHLKTHSVEYRCCLCDKTYISIESLKLHAQKHTNDSTQNLSGENSISCNICNESFSSYNELREHALNHTKEMPFQCDKCEKGFRYHGTLLKHKKVHENSTKNK